MSADGTIPEAATLLADKGDARVYHATWQQLAKVVGQVDTLIVDAPYSERTHAGHDGGAIVANRAADWAARNANSTGARSWSVKHATTQKAERRTLSYPAWTSVDVDAFVNAWAPITTGWVVSLTDHVLAPAWAAALDRAGRYVFSPLACVEPGSRVRMTGDGPSQWSCFAVVARPKHGAANKWGALPGAYVVPPGHGDDGRRTGGGVRITGGKPAWLMERLVSDYSRPGDLVCDPCCGAGTTLTAAVRVGRRAVGGDMKREHAEMAARAVNSAIQTPLFGGAA